MVGFSNSYGPGLEVSWTDVLDFWIKNADRRAEGHVCRPFFPHDDFRMPAGRMPRQLRAYSRALFLCLGFSMALALARGISSEPRSRALLSEGAGVSKPQRAAHNWPASCTPLGVGCANRIWLARYCAMAPTQQIPRPNPALHAAQAKRPCVQSGYRVLILLTIRRFSAGVTRITHQ